MFKAKKIVLIIITIAITLTIGLAIIMSQQNKLPDDAPDGTYEMRDNDGKSYWILKSGTTQTIIKEGEHSFSRTSIKVRERKEIN